MRQKIILSMTGFILIIILSLAIQFNSASLYPNSIVTINRVNFEENVQRIEATVLNGEEQGEKRFFIAPYQENEADSIHFKVGDQVFFKEDDILEKKRDGFVFFMISSLLLTLLLVGGKVGLTTFISVILNSSALFLIVFYYRTLPSFPMLQMMMVYMLFAVAVTLFLIDGIKKGSLQKFVATITTILVAFSLCYFTMEILQDKNLRFENLEGLTRPYRPVFLSSLLIGTIGASLDTVVSVFAILEEIEAKNRRITLSELVESGKTVGTDVSGTMINVLICSYFSSSIPMFLLYLFNGWPFIHSVEMLFSLEALRVLCGGFGILLSIPISLGIFYLGRRKIE